MRRSWTSFQAPLSSVRGVTGWCRGCCPRTCRRRRPPPPRSQRRGVWGSRPASASGRARTPACSRSGRTAGGAPPPPTAGTAGGTGRLALGLDQNKRRGSVEEFLLHLPVRVCSSLGRISLQTNSRPSPDARGRNTSASYRRRVKTESRISPSLPEEPHFFFYGSPTESCGSSGREPGPGFSPSWPDALGCRGSKTWRQQVGIGWKLSGTTSSCDASSTSPQ